MPLHPAPPTHHTTLLNPPTHPTPPHPTHHPTHNQGTHPTHHPTHNQGTHLLMRDAMDAF